MSEDILSRIRHLVRDLRADGNGWILSLVSLGWFFSIGIRFSYPTLLPYFQAEYSITLATAGLLVSMLWVAYAIGQFPGGVLGDWIGEGNILVASTLLSVIGITVIAVSTGAYVLFAGTIAFGFATALYGPTRFTILTDIYEERSGTAIGVTMAAGSVGNTLLPILAGFLASYASWRLGFGLLVPVFVGISVAFWVILPPRTSPPVDNGDLFSRQLIQNLYAAVRHRGISTVLLVQIIAGFVGQGFLTFYPTYLIDIKNYSPTMAASIFGLYFAAGIVVQPLSGMSQDYFGPRKTLIVLLAIYTATLFGIQFSDHLLAIGLLTVLLSTRTGIGVINNTYVSSVLPDGIQGSGLGLLRTVWILIGASSPFIIGSLADQNYFEEGFLLLAVLAGIGTILAIFVPDR